MSDELDLQIKKVKSLIESNEIVKEYFRLKSLIQNDKYLTKLDESVRKQQKKMSLALNDDQKYEVEKAKYLSLYNEYHNNPIVSNYETIKEEVYNLLNQVKDLLS